MTMPEVPDTILRAMALREKALADAARWDSFITMWQELEGVVESGTPPNARSNPATSPLHSKPPPTRRAARANESDELSAEIVSESGPKTTRALLAALAARGHVVVGKDPYGTLHTRLSRGTRLEFDKVAGWKLRNTAGASERPDNQIAGGVISEAPSEIRPPAPPQEGEPAMPARDSSQD
jgi:hypothetical protein